MSFHFIPDSFLQPNFPLASLQYSKKEMSISSKFVFVFGTSRRDSLERPMFIFVPVFFSFSFWKKFSGTFRLLNAKSSSFGSKRVLIFLPQKKFRVDIELFAFSIALSAPENFVKTSEFGALWPALKDLASQMVVNNLCFLHHEL